MRCFLHSFQCFSGDLALNFGGISRFFGGISGNLSIVQALADEPQLPNKESKLQTADYYQEEREETGSIFRQPWFLTLGLCAGFIGGLGIGWIAIRADPGSLDL